MKKTAKIPARKISELKKNIAALIEQFDGDELIVEYDFGALGRAPKLKIEMTGVDYSMLFDMKRKGGKNG